MQNEPTSNATGKEEFLIQLKSLIYDGNCRNEQKLNGFLDYLAVQEPASFLSSERYHGLQNTDCEKHFDIKALVRLARASLNEQRKHLFAVNKLKEIHSALSLDLEPSIILRHDLDEKLHAELGKIQEPAERSYFLLCLSFQVRSVLSELLADRTVHTYKDTDEQDLYNIAEQLDHLGRSHVSEERWEEAMRTISVHFSNIEI
jgi:hypothetical protein